MAWWREKPIRFLQTNLREIYADLDPDPYIEHLKAFAVNVVLLNVGGIAANYPTDLEFHYRNPYLQGDLAGDIITRAKAADIRFIARFDFSKINETYARQKPEWLYTRSTGCAHFANR